MLKLPLKLGLKKQIAKNNPYNRELKIMINSSLEKSYMTSAPFWSDDFAEEMKFGGSL